MGEMCSMRFAHGESWQLHLLSIAGMVAELWQAAFIISRNA
jgi:hypothetical protein